MCRHESVWNDSQVVIQQESTKLTSPSAKMPADYFNTYWHSIFIKLPNYYFQSRSPKCMKQNVPSPRLTSTALCLYNTHRTFL